MSRRSDAIVKLKGMLDAIQREKATYDHTCNRSDTVRCEGCIAFNSSPFAKAAWETVFQLGDVLREDMPKMGENRALTVIF